MRLRLIILLLVCFSVACGKTESPVDAAAADTIEADNGNEAPDEGPEQPDLPEADLPDEPDEGGSQPADCAAICAKFVDCPLLSKSLCMQRCQDSGGEGSCDYTCLKNADKCSGAEWCLDLHAPGPIFKDGPYGTAWRERAGSMIVETLQGPWSLQDEWTGNDSYVFFFTSEGYDYPAKLWDTGIKSWLSQSPPNAHYFFGSFNEAPEADVMAMREKIEAVMEEMSPYKACHWRPRIHYITEPPQGVDGWLGEKLQAQGSFTMAVDRQQDIRQVGSLSSVTTGWEPSISLVAYEIQYFNFEFQRAQALAAETVTEVVAFDNVETGSVTFEVEFPDKETMAGFDTLVVDLGEYCSDHDDTNCAEWDTGASLSVCHQIKEPNPWTETACQAKLTVEDGDDVPAETKLCECVAPNGDITEAVATCNAEGTGFGDCACPCSNEVARWITTYHREGRWLTDISPFLPNFQKGGAVRMHLSPGHKYIIDLSFRLSNTGKPDKADELVYLYDGGSFNLSYNKKFEPKTVSIPDDVKRVELVTLITGHGWGKELANCAEFCLHTHHFTINGKAYVRKHDKAYSPGNANGCAKHVSEGVVPNQYGTWPLGRAGWCPGFDVKPWIKDVSSSITPGEDAVISYKGLFLGKDYEPKPSKDPNPQGFGANIWMNSWLVYYR